MKIIPYGKQFIDKFDIKAVSKALTKDKITTGEITIKFEQKIKNFLNCKYSLSCNSGTSAIFLALASIELKENDVVIMPTINFIASYNISKLFKAKVFLADVDSLSGQMTPQDVVNCCKKFNLKNVKAIIVMYNAGYPSNAELFYKFKNKLNCYIIEDACHALGAEYTVNYKRFKIGSCKHADISTFSLHPLKTITTGEGGIITTNSRKIYNKCAAIRSHGIKRLKRHWQYKVSYHGFNFRLNDFQCALGISQLSKIKKFLRYRKKIANKYNKLLSNVSEVDTPQNLKKYTSSNHLYIINLKKPSHKKKQKLLKFMLKNKIFLQYHYIPIYEFKVCKDKHISKNSRKYYESALSLPIYYKLSSKDQNFVVKKIKEFFKHTTKKNL